MQTILDSITRHITINDTNYLDCKLKQGDNITVLITDLDINSVRPGITYTMVFSDNYIAESEIQLRLANKWNLGQLIYDKQLVVKVISIRPNMLKVESEQFNGWVLKQYIEKVY